MENQKTSLILALPKTSNKTVRFIPRRHVYICLSARSPLSLVMFLTIVAEMTTKCNRQIISNQRESPLRGGAGGRTSLLSVSFISSPRYARRDDEHPLAVCYSSWERRRRASTKPPKPRPVISRPADSLISRSPSMPVWANPPPGRLCGGWAGGAPTS